MWVGVERLQYYRRDFPHWRPKDWAALVPRLARDPVGIDLLASMLSYNPESRITAGQALRHPWFDDIRRTEARTPSSIAAATSTQQLAPGLAAMAGVNRLTPFSRLPGAGAVPVQHEPPYVQGQQHLQQGHGQQQQFQAAPQLPTQFAFNMQASAATHAAGAAVPGSWASMSMAALGQPTSSNLQPEQQPHHPLPA